MLRRLRGVRCALAWPEDSGRSPAPDSRWLAHSRRHPASSGSAGSSRMAECHVRGGAGGARSLLAAIGAGHSSAPAGVGVGPSKILATQLQPKEIAAGSIRLTELAGLRDAGESRAALDRCESCQGPPLRRQQFSLWTRWVRRVTSPGADRSGHDENRRSVWEHKKTSAEVGAGLAGLV